MNQDADRATARRPASRDGLAAVAIIIVTVAIIVLVVTSLV